MTSVSRTKQRLRNRLSHLQQVSVLVSVVKVISPWLEMWPGGSTWLTHLRSGSIKKYKHVCSSLLSHMLRWSTHRGLHSLVSDSFSKHGILF